MLFEWPAPLADVFRRRAVAIVSVAGVLTLAVQILFLRPPIIIGEPYLIAQHVLHGSGYVLQYPFSAGARPQAYIPPLYSLLLLTPLGQSVQSVQIFNLVLLGCANMVLFLWFRTLIGERAAAVGFLALCCYVPLCLLAECLDPNALNILLLALTLRAITSIISNAPEVPPTLGPWLQLGILFGLQLLVRPDIVIGAAGAIIYLVWTFRRKIWVLGMRLALVSAVAAVIVMPWAVRNYQLFHRFIPASTSGGYNLFVGNNPGAEGDLYYRRTPEVRGMESELAAFSAVHSQPELDAHLQEMALAWTMSHPIETLALDLKKAALHWIGKTEGAASGTTSAHAVLFYGTNVLLVLVGSAGMLLLPGGRTPTGRMKQLLVLLFLYSTLVSAIFFVQTRHRMIKCDPALLYLAAYALVRAWERYRQSPSLPT